MKSIHRLAECIQQTPNYALERTVMDKVQLGIGRAPASRARLALLTPHQSAAQRGRYAAGPIRFARLEW